MSNQKKKLTFEEALAGLEEIVSSLESGELALDDALSAFEKGVLLVKQCQTQLHAAEQKVSLLLKNGDGDITGETRPFDKTTIQTGESS